MEVFWNPYPCANPAGVCQAGVGAAGITALNRSMGCLHLNSDEQCLPFACPGFVCGNACPSLCAADKTDEECYAQWEAEPRHDTPCVESYLHHMARVVARTPVAGCTGECCGDVKAPTGTGCCTQAWGADDGTCWGLNSGDARAYDLSQEQVFSFGDATPQAVAYSNYFNVLATCLRSACFCPQGSGARDFSDAARLGCSGQGECIWTNEGSRADPAQYACVCDEGFSGVACSAASAGPDGLCPEGWDPSSWSLQPCSGPAQGVCDSSTGACSCGPGFEGAACDVQSCAVTEDGEVCGGGGTCLWTRECACFEGYSGSACQCFTDGDGKTTCKTVAGGAVTPAGDGTDTASTITDSKSVAQAAAHKTFLQRFAGVLIALVVAILLYIMLFPAPQPPRGAPPLDTISSIAKSTG